MTTRLDYDTKIELKQECKLLRQEFGTQEQAAEYTRVEQGQISEYENRNKLDAFMALDVLADLLKESRSDRVLKVLARLGGYVTIKLPEGRGPAAVLEASGRSAAELGALMMEVGQALRDGHITGAEARRILVLIHELMIDLASLAEAIRREGEGEEA